MSARESKAIENKCMAREIIRNNLQIVGSKYNGKYIALLLPAQLKI